MHSKKIKTVLLITGFLITAIAGYEFGLSVGEQTLLEKPPQEIISATSNNVATTVDFSIFWETWHEIEQNFFHKEPLDYQKMVYGAVSGMVKSLGDPYTNFFTPQETKEFNQTLSGHYEGVGMIVGIKDDILQVISPFKGTPAEKAGLKPGDKIIQINDIITKGMSLEKAVNLIKGPKGTYVKLLIIRGKWTKPKEFTIKRDIIHIPTTEWELKNGDIALIKIYQFNGVLVSDFQKEALEILHSPARKIILDLRSNPGGYLPVSQKIAGWFLKKGETVVWQVSMNGEKKAYKSPGPSKFANYPTVCLINKGTASAAEILAGSLRDQRGVKLIGETSFGKGSVQEEIPLSDNSSLKVTVAKWLTPNGTSIDKQGLEPDIKVKISEKDAQANKDTQLEKAIEFLESIKNQK